MSAACDPLRRGPTARRAAEERGVALVWAAALMLPLLLIMFVTVYFAATEVRALKSQRSAIELARAGAVNLGNKQATLNTMKWAADFLFYGESEEPIKFAKAVESEQELAPNLKVQFTYLAAAQDQVKTQVNWSEDILAGIFGMQPHLTNGVGVASEQPTHVAYMFDNSVSLIQMETEGKGLDYLLASAGVPESVLSSFAGAPSGPAIEAVRQYLPGYMRAIDAAQYAKFIVGASAPGATCGSLNLHDQGAVTNYLCGSSGTKFIDSDPVWDLPGSLTGISAAFPGDSVNACWQVASDWFSLPCGSTINPESAQGPFMMQYNYLRNFYTDQYREMKHFYANLLLMTNELADLTTVDLFAAASPYGAVLNPITNQYIDGVVRLYHGPDPLNADISPKAVHFRKVKPVSGGAEVEVHTAFGIDAAGGSMVHFAPHIRPGLPKLHKLLHKQNDLAVAGYPSIREQIFGPLVKNLYSFPGVKWNPRVEGHSGSFGQGEVGQDLGAFESISIMGDAGDGSNNKGFWVNRYGNAIKAGVQLEGRNTLPWVLNLMGPIPGGTDTVGQLRQTLNVFQLNPGYRRMAVLVTDGFPSIEVDPSKVPSDEIYKTLGYQIVSKTFDSQMQEIKDVLIPQYKKEGIILITVFTDTTMPNSDLAQKQKFAELMNNPSEGRFFLQIQVQDGSIAAAQQNQKQLTNLVSSLAAAMSQVATLWTL